MKAFFLSLFLLSSSAFACPNIDGTYKLTESLSARISNASCDQATLEILDSNGNSVATRTDLYDGKVRESEWLQPYELSSHVWVGDELHSTYYLKDTGELTISIVTVSPNGDLQDKSTHFRQGKSQQVIKTWVRQP